MVWRRKVGPAEIETTMRTVSPAYAAAHLAELIREVSGGEEVLIADGGTPLARLLAPAVQARPAAGEGPDAPSEEVEQAFHGD